MYIAQEPIADDGSCDCPEGGGDVNVTWSVPQELCGWDNVTPVATLTCTTCEDTHPQMLNLSIGELKPSRRIHLVQQLAADNNYTFQVNATTSCGDTIVRTCEGNSIIAYVATLAGVTQIA